MHAFGINFTNLNCSIIVLNQFFVRFQSELLYFNLLPFLRNMFKSSDMWNFINFDDFRLWMRFSLTYRVLFWDQLNFSKSRQHYYIRDEKNQLFIKKSVWSSFFLFTLLLYPVSSVLPVLGVVMPMFLNIHRREHKMEQNVKQNFNELSFLLKYGSDYAYQMHEFSMI